MAEKRKAPGWLKGLLRVLVGGAVFAVLVARTDLGELKTQLSHARGGYIVAAIGLFFAGLGVSAFRWREYLIALEYPMPYTTLFRLYFVGTFFNAFLPTGVGGDAYKAVRIGRAHGRTARAFSSVFLDRFAGIIGLALIGLTFSLIRLASGDHTWVPGLAALASLGILSAAGILLLFGERLLGRGRLVPHSGIGAKLRDIVRGIHEAGRHPRAAAAGLLLGVGFQAIVLWFHLLIASSLHMRVPIPVMASIVVLVNMAILVPISLSGIGVVEFVYQHALTAYGGQPRAIAFALIVRAVSLLSSAAGGLVYLIVGGEVAVETPSDVESRAQ